MPRSQTCPNHDGEVVSPEMKATGLITAGAVLAVLAAPAQARVVGHGSPAGCTSAAVIAAVRAGGLIRFNCGPRPVTIRMKATAKVRNTSRRVFLDGGGLVTLSGQGRHRILYMDTCDPEQVWTTSHCQDQARPELVVRNMAFINGNSTGQDFDGVAEGRSSIAGGGCASSTPLSGPTAASTTGRTWAAEPCGPSPSTATSRCTWWPAGSSRTLALMAPR